MQTIRVVGKDLQGRSVAGAVADLYNGSGGAKIASDQIPANFTVKFGQTYYVVANGERFDPGVRLDCLDALKARSDDEQVRRALVAAARKDQNAAVRLKALEALRDSTGEASVRETLLEALRHDANPGVRVEAVNLLVRSLQGDSQEGPAFASALPATEVTSLSGDSSVERIVRALEDLQRRDPNRYVRLRSAAALRQIGSRDVQ